MKKPNLDIVNLIGITLIVVAIVSAGGIYYTASTWANISEAYATVEVEISDVNIVRYNSTGQIIITASFIVNNPSNLDIEIYRIEYLAYADSSPGFTTDIEKYVASGTVGNMNNTITAGSIREIQLSTSINPNTRSMERFDAAEHDGSVYIFLNSIAWYRVIDYPEATQRMDGIFFMDNEVIYNG